MNERTLKETSIRGATSACQWARGDSGPTVPEKEVIGFSKTSGVLGEWKTKEKKGLGRQSV